MSVRMCLQDVIVHKKNDIDRNIKWFFTSSEKTKVCDWWISSYPSKMWIHPARAWVQPSLIMWGSLWWIIYN